MLKSGESGEIGHPCPFRDHCGKAYSFSPWSMMSASGFFVDILYQVEEVPSIPRWLIFFYHDSVLDFVQCFSASIDMIMWFFFFSLLMWKIIFIYFWMLNQPWIPGINPTWWWCVILFIHSWIWFANIFWGFLYLFSWVISACSFPFL